MSSLHDLVSAAAAAGVAAVVPDFAAVLDVVAVAAVNFDETVWPFVAVGGAAASSPVEAAPRETTT